MLHIILSLIHCPQRIGARLCMSENNCIQHFISLRYKEVDIHISLWEVNMCSIYIGQGISASFWYEQGLPTSRHESIVCIRFTEPAASSLLHALVLHFCRHEKSFRIAHAHCKYGSYSFGYFSTDVTHHWDSKIAVLQKVLHNAHTLLFLSLRVCCWFLHWYWSTLPYTSPVKVINVLCVNFFLILAAFRQLFVHFLITLFC